ncbi:MAG: hypothetical protein JNL98_31485 [Bryobacterales bacterium]|nr:hypothetical protein [Bryobacterales bacterium]
MKVLTDECLPHKLRLHLQDEAVTAVYTGFGGRKNGALLDAAEAAGFDVLVTGDRAMPAQQNLSKRRLAVVALSAQVWEIVRLHMEEIESAISAATPGAITTVDIGTFSRKTQRLPWL